MTLKYKERLFIKSYEYDLLNHKNKMLLFWLETKKRYVEKLYGKTVIEPNMSKKVNKFKKYPQKRKTHSIQEVSNNWKNYIISITIHMNSNRPYSL